ncbi:SOSS complex subunit C [Heterocephalus glaber]|uniref:SOSS complex subunit C n=1 Tax=Heterocephalus glaber TaxID=10181 RepID=G5BWR4_HETGA|nr:SOSS complex subunit C [Heterocephalus glaber]
MQIPLDRGLRVQTEGGTSALGLHQSGSGSEAGREGCGAGVEVFFPLRSRGRLDSRDRTVRTPGRPPVLGFQNKNRVAILAELDKEKRKLLMQNQSSTNHPGASIALSRPSLNKDFRDHAEQQHIAAQQKAALQHAHAHSSGYFITQDSAFGNLILPVLPRLDTE